MNGAYRHIGKEKGNFRIALFFIIYEDSVL
jgi:hypothetical protein